MESANAELTFYQDVCWYIPADRFVAVKIFDSLLHIVHKNRLKQTFTGNIKFLSACLSAGMIYKFNENVVYTIITCVYRKALEPSV